MSALEALWGSAMHDLGRFIKEDSQLPEQGLAKSFEAYTQYRTSYLKYHSVYCRLDEVYNRTADSLERLELGSLLDLVISRMVCLRGLAAKWHPLPPDFADSREGRPLAWECIEWSDLRENAVVSGSGASDTSDGSSGNGGNFSNSAAHAHLLRVTEATSVRPPNYFLDAVRVLPPAPHHAAEPGVVKAPVRYLEDSLAIRSARDSLVSSLNERKLGAKLGVVGVETDLLEKAAAGKAAPKIEYESAADAIAVIMRYERGRASQLRVEALRKETLEKSRLVLKAKERLEKSGQTSKSVVAAKTPQSGETDDGITTEFTDIDGENGLGDEEEDDDNLMTPDMAATHIQRIARGMLARKMSKRRRAREAYFLGMQMEESMAVRLGAVEAKASELAASRAASADASRAALPGLVSDALAAVSRDEAPSMKEAYRMARMAWITKSMELGVIPDSVGTRGGGPLQEPPTMFYAPPPLSKEDKEALNLRIKEKKDRYEAAKAAAAAITEVPLQTPPSLRINLTPATTAAAVGGATGGEDDDVDDDETITWPPPLPLSDWGARVLSVHGRYESLVKEGGTSWGAKRVKELVRGHCEVDSEELVDASMNSIILNIKAAQVKKSKAKRATKPRKPKKPKLNAGEKWWDKRLEKQKPTNADYLDYLAENKVLNTPRQSATFAQFLAPYSSSVSSISDWVSPEVKSKLDASRFRIKVPPAAPAAKGKDGKPAPPPPTAGSNEDHAIFLPPALPYHSIIEAITSLAVLPMGSPAVLEEVDAFAYTHKLWKNCAPRSILLYGPPGVGKTHIAQAVANSLGALFLNLSAGNLEGKFTDKDGPVGVLQAVFDCAKSPSLGPAVIYIDEVEKLIPGGKPKKGVGGSAGPDRFKKPLPGYINGLRWIPPPPPIKGAPPPPPPPLHHRAIVIACSSDPTLADPKVASDCFDASFFVPPPSHSERLSAWKWEVMERLAIGAAATNTLTPSVGGGSAATKGTASLLLPTKLSVHLPSSLNFTALASISEGFTVGAIRAAVAATLTPSRVSPSNLKEFPLQEEEFLSALSTFSVVSDETMEKFRDFQDVMLGYLAARTPPDPNAGKPPKK